MQGGLAGQLAEDFCDDGPTNEALDAVFAADVERPGVAQGLEGPAEEICVSLLSLLVVCTAVHAVKASSLWE